MLPWCQSKFIIHLFLLLLLFFCILRFRWFMINAHRNVYVLSFQEKITISSLLSNDEVLALLLHELNNGKTLQEPANTVTKNGPRVLATSLDSNYMMLLYCRALREDACEVPSFKEETDGRRRWRRTRGGVLLDGEEFIGFLVSHIEEVPKTCLELLFVVC